MPLQDLQILIFSYMLRFYSALNTNAFRNIRQENSDAFSLKTVLTSLRKLDQLKITVLKYMNTSSKELKKIRARADHTRKDEQDLKTNLKYISII